MARRNQAHEVVPRRRRSGDPRDREQQCRADRSQAGQVRLGDRQALEDVDAAQLAVEAVSMSRPIAGRSS